ncbi:membrane-spanning 4-domains subfamily A member 12-like [Clarias gariepinus]|uniref:membrane-spanning 4-domains subfamily A member 12-like n=1 Tax=Clarias gariepinus TaxID=13013 RepID=UPI00234D8AD7|nr:membrane-spanning 4-domains subfamily A member 12-like [Clarias gariepinus]
MNSQVAANGHSVPSGLNVVSTSPSPILRFLKAEPKALGTVQIMIGLISLMFGIVFVADPQFALFSVFSGHLFWGTIFYIITGSLSIAAANNLNSCLVQGSLGMNVVSALGSTAGIGLLTTDIFLNYICFFNDCYRFKARSKAISAVLLVFTILQLILSITISAFACKATCSSQLMLPVMYSNQGATVNTQDAIDRPKGAGEVIFSCDTPIALK